jgi:hypothetical protein
VTALSGSLRTELAEMKQILLGMSSKNTPSPKWKTHRRAKESEAASLSSNDEIMAAASTSPTEQDSRWDSMCESGAEQNGRPPPVMVTLATLEDFDMNGVDTSIRKSDRDMRKVRDQNTHSKPSEASPTGLTDVSLKTYGKDTSDTFPSASDAGYMVTNPESPPSQKPPWILLSNL